MGVQLGIEKKKIDQFNMLEVFSKWASTRRLRGAGNWNAGGGGERSVSSFVPRDCFHRLPEIKGPASSEAGPLHIPPFNLSPTG
jgi:hypothetical protein